MDISRTNQRDSIPDRDRMAGLFTRQAAEYAAARPVYPKDLFAKLASLTAHHRVAWDVGTGNGQAAIGVAEHYDMVVATDVSTEQLQRAVPHPKVRYLHTPNASAAAPADDDLVAALGGEGRVDLITVAEAAHWFDLPAFYGVARQLLRKPGGVIAVWGYNYRVSPVEDMMARFLDTTLPYWDSRARYVIDGYRDLPFPFDGVGLGKEGEPAGFDMEHEMAFAGLVGMLRSWSAVAMARQRGSEAWTCWTSARCGGWRKIGVARRWSARSPSKLSCLPAPSGATTHARAPFMESLMFVQ